MAENDVIAGGEAQSYGVSRHLIVSEYLEVHAKPISARGAAAWIVSVIEIFEKLFGYRRLACDSYECPVGRLELRASLPVRMLQIPTRESTQCCAETDLDSMYKDDEMFPVQEELVRPRKIVALIPYFYTLNSYQYTQFFTTS